MKIREAEYLISSPSVDKCPKPDKREFAFIGRSNVGKSSLINMLTGKRELAKVSHLKNEYKNAKLEAPPVRLVNDRNDLISFFRCFWYSTSKRF